MKLKKEKPIKKQIGLIMHVLFLNCFVFGMFFICPLKAEADLDFGWGVHTRLYVDGEYWVKEGVVQKTFKSDGKGGTAVYNPTENTLTLTNYTFKGDEEGYEYAPITARYMSDKFRIILKGTNIIERKERIKSYERKGIIIELTNCTTIEGNGRLISNVPIMLSTDGNKLVIKDCDIEISALHSGICGTCVELINANVDITIEKEEVRPGVMGFWAYYLKVDNSNLIVKGKNYKTMWINRRVMPVDIVVVPDSFYKEKIYTDNWEDKIDLGTDVKVTDEKGNPLHAGAFGLEGSYWFTFFDSNQESAENIYITSTQKSSLNQSIDEVVKLIDQIGIVSASSKPAIDNARNAYEALSRLGKEADYAKEKVYNYQKLLDAEADYPNVVKQEQEGKKQEEENKKQENTKESQNINGTIVGSRTRKADKIIQVKGKKYRVKTPEFKSLKSKTKKTISLSWKADKTCSGYQIYYSTNKNFKGAKKLLIDKKTTKAKTIKKLRSNRTYYVKMRTYRKIGGKRYYGNFSVIRKIKVK